VFILFLTVASGAGFDKCIENIDIGGPSMLRSSAKNHAYVAVLSSPSQYSHFLEEYERTNGSTSLSLRRRLASDAFSSSASYDSAIATYFAGQLGKDESSSSNPKAVVSTSSSSDSHSVVSRSYQPQFQLKYGCNPHQKPSVIYSHLGKNLPFAVINGTPGYINLLDACNAWQLVLELKQALNLPAAASFKHCSPAGAAVGVPLTGKFV
jgi:phosphoribosylaminoimidazolecarboxamide formyltransferase/IMP cyclohydrolase